GMLYADGYVGDEKFNNIEVTPFLNKLSKNGLYFSNFYAQESVGTSSDSEFTLNSSLLPASNGTVFINYFNRNYLTIPKLLKKQDYYSFSMHGNDGAFWNRNV
ncbi:MAG: sulfatase-like hydrolase/transferase, partial [Bacilli bacterium]